MFFALVFEWVGIKNLLTNNNNKKNIFWLHFFGKRRTDNQEPLIIYLHT